MAGLVVAALAAGACIAWAVLLAFRGGFWRADQRLGGAAALPARPPAVVCVIPARNEAATIGRAVASLAAQDYPRPIDVVVVDDGSDDGTAEAAAAPGVTVVAGAPLPAGWTGKLWAVHQGLEAAAARHPDAEFVLLTDADIAHGPDVVRRLVARAEADGRVLVSLMVRLRCANAWERLLIPPFVFFFQKLYPFARVNDPARAEAAAAGGCMLVRRSALDAIGGVGRIRDRLIDDCALAGALAGEGPIWLGLTRASESLRGYDTLAGVWGMVARTAYTQLGHSPANLAAAVAGMGLVYLVPPAAAAFGLVAGSAPAAGLGAAAWLAMAWAIRPTLALYDLAAWRGLLLPVVAFLYTAMTVDSARRHRLGRGGTWKGRSYGGLRARGG